MAEGDRRIDLHFSVRSLALPEDASWYHDWEDDNGGVLFSAARLDDHYWLDFAGAALFHLDPGSGVIACDPDESVDEAGLRHLLLDQVIPRFLALGGGLVLHASCIELGGEYVALAGSSGAGKSTLAAALSSHLTLPGDDCLLIEQSGLPLLATPAYPGLRLWPDSADALGVDATLPVSEHSEKKRSAAVGGKNVRPQPLPLRTVVLLQPGLHSQSSPSLEPLEGAAAAMALLENTFRMRFTAASEAAALALIAQILEQGLSIKRLKFAHDYQRLEPLCDLLRRTLG